MTFEPFDINYVYASARKVDDIYTMAWYAYASEHYTGQHIKLINSQALRANISANKTEKELERWCLLIAKLSIDDQIFDSEVGPLLRDFYEAYSDKTAIAALMTKTIASIKNYTERDYVMEFCAHKPESFDIISEMELDLSEMMYLYQDNEAMDYRSKTFQYMLQYIYQIKHADQMTSNTDDLESRLYLARFVARTSIFAGSNLEQTMDACFKEDNSKLVFLITTLTKAEAWKKIVLADEYFKQLDRVINNAEPLLAKRFPDAYKKYQTIISIGAELRPSELLNHLKIDTVINTLELPSL